MAQRRKKHNRHSNISTDIWELNDRNHKVLT